jgi:hypothetical protein
LPYSVTQQAWSLKPDSARERRGPVRRWVQLLRVDHLTILHVFGVERIALRPATNSFKTWALITPPANGFLMVNRSRRGEDPRRPDRPARPYS